jgi:hypothetical protein
MVDVAALFARQAAWQRSRQGATWEEKIRLVESVLESLRKLRRTGSSSATVSEGVGPTPVPRSTI